MSVFPVLMPVLAVLFILILAVVSIIVVGYIIGKRQTAISLRSFEGLAQEIRQEYASIGKELRDIQEKVASMEHMMKDI